jgi:biofilm PGA synthesis N-glycosyltransferase PgaC
MFKVSLGIMAYNEEANIGELLHAVVNQKFHRDELSEIFVVASGCTDRTVEIVNKFAQRDSRIKPLVQIRREGKASAINLFLDHATGEIIILESGDTIPDPETFQRLIEPFSDSNVGMTGAHPIPVNSKNTFVGFVVNLMWNLHHKIALATPKLGELVAFRSMVKAIPKDTAVDEASIEAIVRDEGYTLRYVPDAIVHNKGPESIMDFIKQRRRITVGHKHLMHEQDYEVSTSSPWKIFGILLGENPGGFRNSVWMVGAIGLEMVGRFLGYYDFHIKKRNPYVWDIASSTKKLSKEP